jgi:hypothetical protein
MAWRTLGLRTLRVAASHVLPSGIFWEALRIKTTTKYLIN